MPSRWTILAAAAVVGVAGSGAGLYYFTDRSVPVLGRREEPVVPAAVALAGDRVVITDGMTTIAELDSTLAGMGAPDLVDASGSVYTVNGGIDIGDGGTLRIAGASVRLSSDAEGATSVVVQSGGTLELSQSDVRSWSADLQATDEVPGDGRAFIAAEGGRIDVDGGDFEALGVDELGKRGITLGPVTDGAGHRLSDVTVRRNVVGVELIEANDSLIRNVVVEDSSTVGVVIDRSVSVRLRDVDILRSAQDGIVMQARTSEVDARGVRISGTGAVGIRIEDNVHDIHVRDADISDSPRAAVSILDSADVTVSSSELWSNEIGVEVAGTADGVVIAHNRIAANRRAGVELVSAGSVATVSNNRIEHNGAGVLISDGNAVVGPGNQIRSNNTGVKSVDPGPGLVIRGNDIKDNFGDGLLLVATTGVEVRGNDINDNAFAAFGLLENGDFIADFRADNDVGGGGRYGWVRVLQDYEVQLVRGAGPVEARNPNPEPVGYFFLKSNNLQRELGELDPRLYPEAAQALLELQAQQAAEEAALAAGTPPPTPGQ